MNQRFLYLFLFLFVAPRANHASYHDHLAPTHNLTLTRTAMELVELDLKLRQSHSNVKIPRLPIHPDSLPLPPPKRKSTFLNTLSRLASPTAAKANRRAQNASVLPNSSGLPTPITTPGKEAGDPFGSFTSASSVGDSPTEHGIADNNNTNASPALNGASPSAAIAAYLTTVSNTPPLRMDRLWKRFVRVRTDDLESVRVERAIKRVRSDLAAHTGLEEKENAKSVSTASLAPSGKESVSVHEKHEFEGVQEEDEGEGEEPVDRHPSKADNATDSTTTQSPPTPPSDTTGDDSGPSRIDDAAVIAVTPTTASDPAASSFTPVDKTRNDADAAAAATTAATTIPIAIDSPISNRMHRSQSAEPDKSHRLSRAYTSSAPSQSGAESQTTGDEESSSSAIGGTPSKRRRKKHSAPSKHHKENVIKEPKKSQRKVVIDDFVMMRVLGKGCAGKVLLVRHKTTEDLFALKAITKRHVLAHQELQHTLTEQAVLKRMAAESRDPFVVKLWWSFHDKDNLFLVMVCSLFLSLFYSVCLVLLLLGFPPRRRSGYSACSMGSTRPRPRTFLRRRDRRRRRRPPRSRCHLPRPQTRKHPHRCRRTHRPHRLWVIQGVPSTPQPLRLQRSFQHPLQ